jgi:glycosyltransferase involved in cell wall biosynthesis
MNHLSISRSIESAVGKSMRVWIVAVNEPVPVVDGNYRYLRCGMLAKMLAERGNKVVWWNATFEHMAKRHRFNKQRSIKIEPNLWVNFLKGPGYDKNISIKRIWHNRCLSRAFERWSFGYTPRPDVLFASVPMLELAEKSVAYGQVFGVPVVVDVMDQWPDIYLTPFPKSLRGIVALALTSEFRRARRIFKNATAVTAVSETYLKWGLGYGSRSCKDTDGIYPLGYCIPNAKAQDINQMRANGLRSKYGIRRDGMVVTYAGTFGASYDLETVIMAAKKLQQQRNNSIQIVIAGSGDKEFRLREMAKGLRNVVFTGWLDPISIFTLLRLSTIGLAAYTRTALQSLPFKPCEYWAAGLPILSSLGGELKRLINDLKVGLYYRPGDADSLINGIEWFSNHPDETSIMRNSARKLFEEEFDAEVIYPRLISQLQTIVDSWVTKG